MPWPKTILAGVIVAFGFALLFTYNKGKADAAAMRDALIEVQASKVSMEARVQALSNANTMLEGALREMTQGVTEAREVMQEANKKIAEFEVYTRRQSREIDSLRRVLQQVSDREPERVEKESNLQTNEAFAQVAAQLNRSF